MEIEVIHTCPQHSGPKWSAGLHEGEKTRSLDSFSRGVTAQSQVLPRQPQGKRATQDQPFVGKRRLAAPLRILHGRHAVLSTFFTAASFNSPQVSARRNDLTAVTLTRSALRRRYPVQFSPLSIHPYTLGNTSTSLNTRTIHLHLNKIPNLVGTCTGAIVIMRL